MSCASGDNGHTLGAGSPWRSAPILKLVLPHTMWTGCIPANPRPNAQRAGLIERCRIWPTLARHLKPCGEGGGQWGNPAA